MTVMEYQVLIEGRPTGVAVNNWYIIDGALPGDEPNSGTVDSAQSSLQTFYQAISSYMPNDALFRFPSAAMAINEVDGKPVAALVGTQPEDIVTGGGTGKNASLASHLKLQTRTGQYSDGRELRGGVFLGPAANSIFNTDGLVAPTAITTVTNAGTNLLSDLSSSGNFLAVWRRPRSASSGLPSRPGSLAIVQSTTCWSRPAVLRSRRD